MCTRIKPKIIHDAVHGVIEVEGLMMQVIDTPEFQRLRHLNQLGCCNYVFPMCNQTRFEHSIGTYHLTRRFLESIQADPRVDPRARELTEGECTSIKLAALCHDLGHGPFSHIFEYFVKAGGPEYSEFKHNVLSGIILRHILKNNPKLKLDLQNVGVDLELVNSLILGQPSVNQLKKLKEKSYIFELLSNSWNGIDIDKLDYIMRDSLHAGWGQGCSVLELERLMRFFRPFEVETGTWHMAFRDSEIENILRIFTTRLHLHQQVYSHKVTAAINVMLLDIFEDLNPMLKLRDVAIKSLTNEEHLIKYLKMDEITIWALASGFLHLAYNRNKPPSASLSHGKGITETSRAERLCQRIQTRCLYPIVGTFYVFDDKTRQIDDHQQKNVDLFVTKIAISDKYALCQTVAIPTNIIGTQKMILTEIAARLSPDSIVKGVDELRIMTHVYSTNSTKCDPVFFAYKGTAKAYPFKQPLIRIARYMLLWTGLDSGKCSPPDDLREAFTSWLEEKLAMVV